MKEIKLGFLLFFFFFVFEAAYPQGAPEKAVREVDKPLYEEARKKLKKPPEEIVSEPKVEVEKPKEDGLKFLAKKIFLKGCQVLKEEEFSSLVEKYKDREISFSELNILAKEIEQEYLRRGIFAVAVVLPQEIKQGEVFLRIIEVKLGEIDIKGDNWYFKKKRLYYYWKLLPQEVIHYGKMRRSLQVMNKNPDRKVKAAVSAGKKEGTSDILLTQQTCFPLHFGARFDREGVEVTGEKRTTFSLQHNNFLGLDDIFLNGFTYGREFEGVYYLYSIPVSSYGTNFLTGFSRSCASPKGEYEASNIRSMAKTYSFSLSQDLFRKDEYFGDIHIGLEAKDKTTTTISGTYVRDRLRIIQAGSNFFAKRQDSITTFSTDLSWGINDLGARNSSYASRQARAAFLKFEPKLKRQQRLPLGLQAVYAVSSQFASRKLTSQEELSLGGIDSVRGYPAGDYLADCGVIQNLDILFPCFFLPQNVRLPFSNVLLKEQITPLIFFDYGYGWLKGPSESEKKTYTLRGIGAGLRINLYDKLAVRLEWGFPQRALPLTDEHAESRFHLSFDFQS